MAEKNYEEELDTLLKYISCDKSKKVIQTLNSFKSICLPSSYIEVITAILLTKKEKHSIKYLNHFFKIAEYDYNYALIMYCIFNDKEQNLIPDKLLSKLGRYIELQIGYNNYIVIDFLINKYKACISKHTEKFTISDDCIPLEHKILPLVICHWSFEHCLKYIDLHKIELSKITYTHRYKCVLGLINRPVIWVVLKKPLSDNEKIIFDTHIKLIDFLAKDVNFLKFNQTDTQKIFSSINNNYESLLSNLNVSFSICGIYRDSEYISLKPNRVNEILAKPYFKKNCYYDGKKKILQTML